MCFQPVDMHATSLLCSSIILCCRLSGTSDGSTLNGVANMFILFTFHVLKLLAKRLMQFCTHSPACSCRVGQVTVLPVSSCNCHSFNFASNYFTFESREPRSWFGPWSLTFSCDRCLVISTIKSKSHSHLSSLSSLQVFP